MKRASTISFLIAVLLVNHVSVATARSYVATILDPPGFTDSKALGIYHGRIGGYVAGPATDGNGHGVLFSNPPGGYADLDPTAYENTAISDVTSDTEVGNGYPIGGMLHALLWHGSAESCVDLHPAEYWFSAAEGAAEGSQVGAGYLSSAGDYRALLWRGTAESAVSLHPPQHFASLAHGASETTQVGEVKTSTGTHAALWRGTAGSFVDLHPRGSFESAAFAATETNQVGYSLTGEYRATLWSGTAASAVDLHPPGYLDSEARGVFGSYQVGQATQPETFARHAFVWRGTAESGIDLHDSLAALDLTFGESFARDVDANGDIVGFGYASDGAYHALKWSLVTVDGDTDGDDDVDLEDLNNVRNNFGGDGLGDTDDDGDVDLDDLNSVRNNFGTVGSNPVPEPSTLALVLTMSSVLGAMCMRRAWLN